MKINLLNFKKSQDNYIKHSSPKTALEENGQEKVSLADMGAGYFSSYNLNFGRCYKPVYLIKSNGYYARFDSRQELAESMGTSKNWITSLLYGKNPQKRDFQVVDAGEIEKKDKDGNINVDFEKIQKIIKELDKSVYIINTVGGCEKFENPKQAADFYGIDTGIILRLISKNMTTYRGFTARAASEVEYEDENGVAKVDSRKIAKISRSINKDIFVIDRMGSIKRYRTETDAAKALGVKPANVSQALLSKGKIMAKGNYVVYARDVETTDEEGNTSFDKKKFSQIIKDNSNSSYIYAIHADGSYEKFSTRKEAAKKLGISLGGLFNALKAPNQMINNIALRCSPDIEIIDKNGNIVPDAQKIQEALKQINQSVYAIYEDGRYRKFSSPQIAAQRLGVGERSIELALNDRNKKVANAFIVRSEAVETTNSAGKTKVDMNKVSDIINKGYDPVYVIKKDGSYEKFNSRMEASKHLNISCANMCVLAGKPVKVKGMLIIHASDVENSDKNNNTTLDVQKISNVIKDADNSVYVIRQDGECIKFQKRIDVAAFLNVSPASVTNALYDKIHLLKDSAVISSQDLEMVDENGRIVIDSEKLGQVLKEING